MICVSFTNSLGPNYNPAQIKNEIIKSFDAKAVLLLLQDNITLRRRLHLPNRQEYLFAKQTNFTFRRVEFRLRHKCSTQLKFIKTGSSKAEHTNNNLYSTDTVKYV